MVLSPTQLLCDQLGRIVGYLQGGDSEAAAVVVTEMQNLLPSLPKTMPDCELSEARQLLEECSLLEEKLRQRIIDSLREVGARRRGLAYRYMAHRR
jgi:hypothetical protein